MLNAEAIEIRRNHTSMVRFQSASEDDFQTVVGHIHLMCEKVEEKISGNWVHWEETKGTQPGNLEQPMVSIFKSSSILYPRANGVS